MIANETPTLLLMAEYTGTLAAARCISKHGGSVTIATPNMLAPARWSKAVQRVVSCPDLDAGPTRVVEWLLAFGTANSRHVLYPTSDEMAWLLAHFREQLRPHFHLYSPPAETLRTLLDKRRLHEAAARVGLGSPRTWHPQEESELAAILRQAGACLIKPRTQTFFNTHAKGELASTLPQLTRLWRQYLRMGYAAEVTGEIDDVGFPMIQEYLPQASRSVVSISGFAIRSGQIIDTRASRKVLQMPAQAGVGLCFESADVDPVLVEKLSALCHSIGYHGVFEAEFIRHDGQDLLIDFNPRYFAQVGFDIARGMHLPWLAQLCATGSEDRACDFTQARAPAARPTYFAHGFNLRWNLLAGALLGTISRPQGRRWRDWLAARPDRYVDAIADANDPAPGLISAAATIWDSIRHPRAFWRRVRAAPSDPEHAPRSPAGMLSYRFGITLLSALALWLVVAD